MVKYFSLLWDYLYGNKDHYNDTTNTSSVSRMMALKIALIFLFSIPIHQFIITHERPFIYSVVIANLLAVPVAVFVNWKFPQMLYRKWYQVALATLLPLSVFLFVITTFVGGSQRKSLDNGEFDSK